MSFSNSVSTRRPVSPSGRATPAEAKAKPKRPTKAPPISLVPSRPSVIVPDSIRTQDFMKIARGMSPRERAALRQNLRRRVATMHTRYGGLYVSRLLAPETKQPLVIEADATYAACLKACPEFVRMARVLAIAAEIVNNGMVVPPEICGSQCLTGEMTAQAEEIARRAYDQALLTHAKVVVDDSDSETCTSDSESESDSD